VGDDLTYTEARHEAFERFAKERGRADRQDFFARIVGKSDDLLPFESLPHILQVHQQIARDEAVMIPLEKIVGSVGRYRDFTRDFRPRERVSADRWVRVFRAMTSLEGVPPIEVYRLGDVYFVSDGNHRVSAARANGFDKIAAHVTEIPVDPGLAPGDTLDKAIIKAERVRFLQETGLEQRFDRIDDIRFTKPGSYPRLLEHIRVHRYFMGLDYPWMSTISFQDAAANWYVEVYRPIVGAIQRRNLHQQFPDSTAADLYIWVSSRIMESEAQLGQKISPEEAVATLDDGGGSSWQHALREMWRVLGEIGDALVGSEAGIPEWAEPSLEWGDFRPPPTYALREQDDE
jgi:hypothetical protein